MGSEHYCLRWNNHQSNLLGVFSQLLRDESLVDVTLACSEGTTIRAHKVVLSACSSYFQTLFVDHPSRHPIVILKDVRFAELKTLVEFMYKGEVNVEYCQLPTLLKTAESLKVKGLAEMTNLATVKEEQNSNREQEKDKNCSQTEPTELVTNKKLVGSTTKDADNDSTPVQTTSCDSPEPLELSKKSEATINEALNDRPSSVETMQPDSPDSEIASSVNQTSSCGANDLSINNNNSTVTSCLTSALPGGLGVSSAICPRLPSPHGGEPVAGPSGLPPVQQVPLSLKKEVQDWSSNLPDDKIIGECSSDYSRQQQETTPMEIERCFNAMASGSDHPASTHSSRSSTPFAFPFPAFTSSLLEDTSARLLGLLHPALFTDESFRCPICLASFPSIWLLEQHTALQHVALNNFTAEDKPFVCDQCGQSYRYRSAYIKHREQNHRARLPADKLFSCDVCGMQFRYLKSFKKHRLNHALERLHGKPDGVISSGIGESATNSEDNEVQDENTAESSSGIAQESNNQVSSSNEMVIEGDKTPPRITIKKELFADDDERGDEDPEVTHSEKEKELEKRTKEKCDQDDTIDSIGFSLPQSAGSSETCSTSQEASILNFLRMDAAERQRERRFACPFCGKCVRSKENLKLHVRKHTGERPFVCLFCGRAFGGKSDLTRHLRIHTGERPYHCEMCGKCFARADYLSKHLTTHINTPR